jgi:hypothetical protein
VKTAKAGMHPDGGGLYLRVTDGRPGDDESPVLKRYWVFRYRQRGTRRDRQLGIGPLDTVTLPAARTAAKQYREQLLEGLDPIEQRNAARAFRAVAGAKAMTFDECRNAYIASHETGWRNAAHRQQWSSTLATYATPVFGYLPVDAVDTGLVVEVLEPIWDEKERDCEQGARPDRGHPRLGQTARLSERTEPGNVEGSSRSSTNRMLRGHGATTTGIIPAPLSFSARVEDCFSMMRSPIWRRSYSMGTWRRANSIITMKATSAIVRNASTPINPIDNTPVRPSCNSRAIERGIATTMLTKKINARPLPTPCAVMMSVSQMSTNVPPVKAITVEKRKKKPGSATIWPIPPSWPKPSSPPAMP